MVDLESGYRAAQEQISKAALQWTQGSSVDQGRERRQTPHYFIPGVISMMITLVFKKKNVFTNIKRSHLNGFWSSSFQSIFRNLYLFSYLILISFSFRSRRSIVTSAKRPGCSLGTCSLQNLVHRLHILNNRLKVNRAPEDKISSQGYGRRRRRSPWSLPQLYALLTLQAGRVRLGWSSESS